MDFDVFELVKTVEFSVPIGGEILTFRLECLQDMARKNCFRFRVGRLDGYRLVPSFPVSEDDTVADGGQLPRMEGKPAYRAAGSGLPPCGNQGVVAAELPGGAVRDRHAVQEARLAPADNLRCSGEYPAGVAPA